MLEEEGEFIFPAFTVRWWNPQLQRMFSRTVKEERVQVAGNPNLGILKTLRDSLSAKPVAAKAKPSGPARIAGMVWYRFVLLMLWGIVLIYIFIRVCIWLSRVIKRRWTDYRASEKYWFRKFYRTKDNALLVPNFYHWWDRSEKAGLPSVENALSPEDELLDAWHKTESVVFNNSSKNESPEELKKKVAIFRKKKKLPESATGNDVQDPFT